MKKITLRDRLRYQFDNAMSKGPGALIGWLFLLSVFLIAVVALVVVARGSIPKGGDFSRSHG